MATEASAQVAFSEACGGAATLDAKKVGGAARAAGASPSLAEISEFTSKAGGGISFAAFKEFCLKTSHKDDPADLGDFLKALDSTGSGVVPKTALRNCLSTFGEPLSVQEIDTVLDAVAPGKDVVDANRLLAALLG